MSCKLVLAAAIAFLVLKCSCASSQQGRNGAAECLVLHFLLAWQDMTEVQPLTELEEAPREKPLTTAISSGPSCFAPRKVEDSRGFGHLEPFDMLSNSTFRSFHSNVPTGQMP